MTFQELPELLTMKQACLLLSVHPNTLRNWEREGKLKAVRIGDRRDRRFLKASIWSMLSPAAE
jgi:excisionase family DNA binding protein